MRLDVLYPALQVAYPLCWIVPAQLLHQVGGSACDFLGELYNIYSLQYYVICPHGI